MTPEQEEYLHKRLDQISKGQVWIAVMLCWFGLLWAFHLLFPIVMRSFGFG